ncbi:MAG: hypothetical protein ACK47B_25620 [Armatimonadota bacterium]
MVDICSSRRRRGLRSFGAAAALLFCALTPVGAWGPHSEITRAALDALPASDRVEARLGTVELARYSWLPDYRDAELPDYSPNHYLLFPEFPRHVSHLTPEVRTTFPPFFRRALQALRTESRANAGRWVGSLLHFVQDSTSPPHALPVSGDLHFRMENWIDAEQVTIPGYRPRRLGGDPEAAIRGLEAAMDTRIARVRRLAEQMRPPAEREDRAAVEALALEAAQESARASADLLHTLLALERGGDRSELARLEILIRAPKLPARPLAPVRLRLLETSFSTFSDALTEATADYYRGRLLLRNVPPGDYRAELTRPGAGTTVLRLRLTAGALHRASLTLPPETRH